MIRLQRVGKKNQAMFRLVLTEKQNGPKSGRFQELLGSYNPHQNEIKFNAEKIKYWISVGAQVSDTVHNLLVSQKIIEGKKKNVLPKKTPIVKESQEDKEEKLEEAPKEEKTETKEEVKEETKDSAPEEVKEEAKTEEAAPKKEETKPAE